MTETVEILRRAFTGDRFSFEGKRFTLRDAQVTPVAQVPPRILLAALSEPAADRAVAIGDGYLGAWPGSLDIYLDALRRAGRAPSDGVIGGVPVWWVVAEDPEREWARVGDHALYQINTYVKWGSFPQAYDNRDDLLASGTWRALTGDQAVEEILELVECYPQLEDIHFFGALPGESTETSTPRLRYLAESVLPRVRERLASR